MNFSIPIILLPNSVVKLPLTACANIPLVSLERILNLVTSSVMNRLNSLDALGILHFRLI